MPRRPHAALLWMAVGVRVQRRARPNVPCTGLAQQRARLPDKQLRLRLWLWLWLLLLRRWHGGH